MLAALGAALVVAVVVSAALTHGFGLWSSGGSGRILEPTRATVFSPGGSPDHPDEAGNVIDGDPNTAWHSDVYLDAKPFPDFKPGVGLILQLPEPTAIGAVTIDLTSTGTEVQIRAADTATPASLSDTTALTSDVPLQPGKNRITVDDHTPTEDVLVWISALGSTDGQSRTEISDITLEAAG